ncbi:MAG: hypothetical protein DWH81_14335 [Planctomycetota bacterium]|nr:MAG: hypothetical protein DWH81_14335 [Planctomycetota bacterium]
MFSIVLTLFTLMIELNLAIYCFGRLHHFDPLRLTMLYVGFIYHWWCCSLSRRITHGQCQA